MLKISKQSSVSLSLALSVLFFIACIVALIFIPTLCRFFIDAEATVGNQSEIATGGRIVIYILAYLLVLVMILADILLFRLLLRVRDQLVFTERSVSLIRGVSWCCFLLCLVLMGLGIYFQLAFVFAFAAIFLGLCLRVVKNVIEEATEIKSENDLTV